MKLLNRELIKYTYEFKKKNFWYQKAQGYYPEGYFVMFKKKSLFDTKIIIELHKQLHSISFLILLNSSIDCNSFSTGETAGLWHLIFFCVNKVKKKKIKAVRWLTPFTIWPKLLACVFFINKTSFLVLPKVLW